MRCRLRERATLVLLAAAMGTALALAGCTGDEEPAITAGVDACDACNMVIDQVNQACGYVREGSFVPFDSPGCLLRTYQALPMQERPLATGIYFADYGDATFHEASGTTFLLTSHLPTVMNAEVICFGNRAAAVTARTHDDEIVTDWPGYRTARGEPDCVVEVTIGTDGMVPESVEVAKGDLVAWRISARGLEHDLTFTIEGYPEVGSVVVPASGAEIQCRLLASRPGAGFPLLAAADGRLLGKLKVTGPHTLDEEAR